MKILLVSYPVNLRSASRFDLGYFNLKAPTLSRSDYAVAVFPELMVGGYHVRDLWLSPVYLKACAACLARIAQIQSQWHGDLPAKDAPIWVIGAPHRFDGNLYNAALVLRRGKIESIYFKNKLANDGVFDEGRYFRAGNEKLVFEKNGERFAVLICEDMWSEEVMNDYTPEYADNYLVLNASPYAIAKHDQRTRRLSNLARKLRSNFISVNLCGAQDELVFDGVNLAIDANGNLQACSPFLADGARAIEVGRGMVRAIDGESESIHALPALEEQWRMALVRAIQDYLLSSGLETVVLGISGGVDSATGLALACDALGAESVQAVMVEGPHTSPLSMKLAKSLARRSGVEYRVVSMAKMFTQAMDILRVGPSSISPVDLVYQNLQARIRCTLLSAYANQTGALLLCNTNKSEAITGYGTLNGDLAGGLAPLLDLTKSRVYRLARAYNRANEWIPQGILQRPPSAELGPNQTDESHLMPYAILDELTHLHLEEGYDWDRLRDLARTPEAPFDRAHLDRFRRLVQSSEFKRRQAPMGIKLSSKLLVFERRYPCNEWLDR